MTTTYHNVRTQVTRIQDVNGKRRIDEQLAILRNFEDEMFIKGARVLQPATVEGLFEAAKVVYLTSDAPVNIYIYDNMTDLLLMEMHGVYVYNFELTDERYNIVVGPDSTTETAKISWFAIADLAASISLCPSHHDMGTYPCP